MAQMDSRIKTSSNKTRNRRDRNKDSSPGASDFGSKPFFYRLAIASASVFLVYDGGMILLWGPQEWLETAYPS